MALEILTEGREHLSKTLIGHQLFWDASSLSAFLKCPRYYFMTMLCGYRPKAESHHLTFGTLYHHGLEFFDRQIVAGLSHDDAVYAMVREILVKSKDFKSEDPNKNRETLLRTLVWYTEEYKEDQFKTYRLSNGEAAVELSFRVLLPFYSSAGEQYGGCGHFDKVATHSGGFYILDKKTTKSTLSSYYFDSYNPDVQMTWYSLAGQIVLEKPISGVVVDGVQIAVGFSRFARGVIFRSKGILGEFMDNLKTIFDLAEWYAQRKEWPMNQTACDKYGGCAFRSVCTADPMLRKHFLSSDYKIEPWNPLVER